MKRLQHALIGLAFIAPICFSQFATAEIVLQQALGISFPESPAYDQGHLLNASVGYSVDDWSYHLGYIHLGEFELNNSTLDAIIISRGPYLEIIKSFKTNTVDFEFGFGLSQIDSKAKLERNTVGSNKDSVPFLEFYAAKNISSLFGIRGGVSYYSDVSGNDITAVGFGLRFSFE